MRSSATPRDERRLRSLRLLRRDGFFALQDLGFRRELLGLAAKNNATRFFAQRLGDRFGMSADDLEVKQDHAQLFHLLLNLFVGAADEFSGVVEKPVGIL